MAMPKARGPHPIARLLTRASHPRHETAQATDADGSSAPMTLSFLAGPPHPRRVGGLTAASMTDTHSKGGLTCTRWLARDAPASRPLSAISIIILRSLLACSSFAWPFSAALHIAKNCPLPPKPIFFHYNRLSYDLVWADRSCLHDYLPSSGQYF